MYKNRLVKYCQHSVFFTLILTSTSSIPSYAALSASTANSIQGSAPYILLNNVALTSIDELLTFKTASSSAVITIDDSIEVNPTSVISIPIGKKFSDLILVTTADGTVRTLNSLPNISAADIDGDITTINPGIVTGNISAEFKDQNGNTITNLNQVMTSCGEQYSLTIEITNNVTAISQYGAPNISDAYSGTTKATYKLLPQAQRFCHIRTGDMTVFDGMTVTNNVSKFPYQNSNNPGGYNDLYWDYDSSTTSHLGFSVTKLRTANKTFPTTGFDKAVMTFVGSKVDQQLFECELDSGSANWVNLSTDNSPYDNKDCQLTFNSIFRPNSKIIVNFKEKTTGLILDTYHFDFDNSSSLWVIAGDHNTVNTKLGTNTYTNHLLPYNNGAWNDEFSGKYLAAASCASLASPVLSGLTDVTLANNYFFTVEQFTNVPRKGVNMWLETFSRDLGSFTSEWGILYGDSVLKGYFGSIWPTSQSYIWTSETASSNKAQYTLYNEKGQIVGTRPDHSGYAICKN